MGRILVVGLGPAGLDRLGAAVRERLLEPEWRVIVRTLEHPAAQELADLRSVESGDDAYEQATTLEDAYRVIVDRVLAAAAEHDVVFAVPGSALVGERTVAMLRSGARERGIACEMLPGESFLDLMLGRLEIDPLQRGVQILDGRSLPDPLPLHLPTVIAQVDRPVVLADVVATLGKVVPDDTPVVVLTDLGSASERVLTMLLGDVGPELAGPRTSLYLDPPAVGWHGLVVTNRRLREECPWDAEQTHHSLLKHLIEEAYETAEVISALPAEAPWGEPDYAGYAAVEDELGDLLLQVVFHATLARETGAFDVEEVAERIRRKLVHRHPHVFGDVEVDDAAEVKANWEQIKTAEKSRHSLMDDVPASLPALARADKLQRRAATVGFDWDDAAPVLAKVEEELAELRADLGDPERRAAEFGDLLFALVNLARHLHVDAEVSLRRAADRFAGRFRGVERQAAASGRDLREMTLEEMDALWDLAKAGDGGTSPDGA